MIPEDLLRRHYSNPKLIQCVCQILLDWSPKLLEEFIFNVKHEALDTFSAVSQLPQPGVQINFPSSGLPPQIVTALSPSMEITIDQTGSKIIVEQSGFRIILQGLYKGRDHLYELVDWVLSRLPHQVHSNRVSLLYQSNILPTENPYEVKDYIVPTFELPDPRLNFFNGYNHGVNLLFGQLIPERPGLRGRLEVSNGVQPMLGIVVSIDVLDDALSSISEIPSRLKLVKAIESHVFENTVTDKTRQLYGVS